MADNAVFGLASERLQEASGLEGVVARGTLRLALRDAGLDSKHVTREQMEVVLDRVMPAMLERRGIQDPDDVCIEVVQSLQVLQGAVAPPDAPESFVLRTRATTQ